MNDKLSSAAARWFRRIFAAALLAVVLRWVYLWFIPKFDRSVGWSIGNAVYMAYLLVCILGFPWMLGQIVGMLGGGDARDRAETGEPDGEEPRA